MQQIVFCVGCFWGAEKLFWRLPGVYSTAVGYAGGDAEATSPTYEVVCTGRTGHAEAVRVVFDPSVLATADLMRCFWQCHDATQIDGQGADVGTQYRSAVFYANAEQRCIPLLLPFHYCPLCASTLPLLLPF